MYLTKLTLQNIRCFKGEHTISLSREVSEDPADWRNYAGWTVLTGRNGSGKTTALRAIVMGLMGSRIPAPYDSPLDWATMGETVAFIDLKAWLEQNEHAEYSIAGGRENKIFAQWTYSIERGIRNYGFGRSSLGRNLEYDKRIGPWGTDPKGFFLAAYGAKRRLGSPGEEIGDPLPVDRFNRVITLFDESATLTESIRWLRFHHLLRLEGHPESDTLITNTLRLLADGLLPDNNRVEEVNSKGLWITRDGVKLPIQQISDGYRAVVSLVVDLIRQLSGAFDDLRFVERDGRWVCELPGVVLIDEVDAHLHVEWQRRLGFWLTTHFPRIQFIVTSHSPFICQAASPKGLIRLPGPGEDRRIEHVPEHIFNGVVNGGIDEAVMSELFGLDSPRSDRAEALRDRVAALEIKVLKKTASEAELEEYKAKKALLPDDMDELADRSVRRLLHSRDAQ